MFEFQGHSPSFRRMNQMNIFQETEFSVLKRLSVFFEDVARSRADFSPFRRQVQHPFNL